MMNKIALSKESRLDFELHNACRRGDFKKIQQILDTGRVHVDCTDQDGTTPLMLSIHGNHNLAVRILLKEGADPNLRKNCGVGPLLLSAQFGFVGIMNELLLYKADKELTTQEGGTALMGACQWGRKECAIKLIESGVDIHAEMKDGTTALFLACQEGHVDVVKLLLTYGATENINKSRQDGATALFIAAQMGHTNVVKELLKVPNIDADKARIDGATPLFKACHKGNVEVVKEILKQKPNLTKLKNGETALHAGVLSGRAEIVEILLSSDSVDPNIINDGGYTSMALAAEAGYHRIASILNDLTLIKSKNNNKLDSRIPDIGSQVSKMVKNPSPCRSSILSSSNNRPRSRSSGANSPKQHVRFANPMMIRSESTNSRRFHHRRQKLTNPIQIVQCKLIDELTTSKKSPVKIIWRTSPGSSISNSQSSSNENLNNLRTSNSESKIVSNNTTTRRF